MDVKDVIDVKGVIEVKGVINVNMLSLLVYTKLSYNNEVSLSALEV